MTTSDDGSAYTSSAPDVLEAWDRWKDHVADVRTRRDAMTERYGRRLMVNRLGFGHGTRVVGFEVLDGEEDGLVIGDNGEIRIPKKGPPYNTATPNIRRKAGKDLASELGTLNENGPDLPGMPGFHLYGFRSLAPALFEHDGVVWARWSDDIEGPREDGREREKPLIDSGLWERQPLSAYYAAREAHEQVAA